MKIIRLLSIPFILIFYYLIYKLQVIPDPEPYECKTCGYRKRKPHVSDKQVYCGYVLWTKNKKWCSDSIKSETKEDCDILGGSKRMSKQKWLSCREKIYLWTK